MHLEMNGSGAPGLHNERKEIVFYVYLCELLKFKCSVYLRQYIFRNSHEYVHLYARFYKRSSLDYFILLNCRGLF